MVEAKELLRLIGAPDSDAALVIEQYHPEFKVKDKGWCTYDPKVGTLVDQKTHKPVDAELKDIEDFKFDMSEV